MSVVGPSAFSLVGRMPVLVVSARSSGVVSMLLWSPVVSPAGFVQSPLRVYSCFVPRIAVLRALWPARCVFPRCGHVQVYRCMRFASILVVSGAVYCAVGPECRCNVLVGSLVWCLVVSRWPCWVGQLTSQVLFWTGWDGPLLKMALNPPGSPVQTLWGCAKTGFSLWPFNCLCK